MFGIERDARQFGALRMVDREPGGGQTPDDGIGQDKPTFGVGVEHLDGGSAVLSQHVTWALGPGERVGLVGVNGSGKTSLLRLLVDQLAPDAGKIVRGVTVKVAYLSQEVAELGVVGVLAVELFETADGHLLVNELAMRPHNSGHWTMDGSRTSQFEQHLRAVLDYPLGDTDAIAPVTVMANVLGAARQPEMTVDERLHHLYARMPDARVHLYGKDERPGRKIGHINFLGHDPAEVANLRERAERAAHWLSDGEWTDGWDPHSNE